MVEYPIARLYTDARVQRIYGGANEVRQDLIARAVTVFVARRQPGPAQASMPMARALPIASSRETACSLP